MDSNFKQKEIRRKKWLKLSKKRSAIRFNQKKLMKKLSLYKDRSDSCPKNSTHEFEYFSGDLRPVTWGRGAQRINSGIPWKAFQGAKNNYERDEKSEVKDSLWKFDKMDSEEYNSDEMWTFGPRKCPMITFSDLGLIDDRVDPLNPEKIFWKTSNMPFPLNEKTTNKSNHHNPKMLWRSLKHLQRFYEENCEDMHNISSLLNADLKNLSGNNGLEIVSDCFFGKNLENGHALRKARLSRWNFLRHDSGRKIEDDPIKPKLNSYSKFFLRKKNYLKEEETKEASEDYSQDFENECTSDSDETCNCSCCSCENCMEGSKSEEFDNHSRSVPMFFL